MTEHQVFMTTHLLLLECKVGYWGVNCTLPCPFNSYGRACQMNCDCSEDECDLAVGCQNGTIGTCFN